MPEPDATPDDPGLGVDPGPGVDPTDLATVLRVLDSLHELPAGHPDIQTVKRATERTNATVAHVRDQIEKSVKRATDQLNDISKSGRGQGKKTVAGDDQRQSADADKTADDQAEAK